MLIKKENLGFCHFGVVAIVYSFTEAENLNFCPCTGVWSNVLWIKSWLVDLCSRTDKRFLTRANPAALAPIGPFFFGRRQSSCSSGVWYDLSHIVLIVPLPPIYYTPALSRPWNPQKTMLFSQIKVFSPVRCSAPQIVCARLCHKSLVQVIDSFTSFTGRGHMYSTLEFVRTDTLTQVK